MAEKPRLLVIERDMPAAASARQLLAENFEVVCARTMARAMVLLREQEFVGVYVDSAQLSAVRWAGMLIQADEILDAIADGVAVVDPDLRIIWTNPEFSLLADPSVATIGTPFYRALGSPEVIGPFACPFYDGQVSYDRGLCPVAERMHDQEAILFSACHANVRPRDLQDVVNAFHRVFGNLKAWEI